MGLVPSMVLRPKSPVESWEDGLVIEIRSAEYAAAYSVSPQSRVRLKQDEVYTLLVHFRIKTAFLLT